MRVICAFEHCASAFMRRTRLPRHTKRVLIAKSSKSPRWSVGDARNDLAVALSEPLLDDAIGGASTPRSWQRLADGLSAAALWRAVISHSPLGFWVLVALKVPAACCSNVCDARGRRECRLSQSLYLVASVSSLATAGRACSSSCSVYSPASGSTAQNSSSCLHLSSARTAPSSECVRFSQANAMADRSTSNDEISSVFMASSTW